MVESLNPRVRQYLFPKKHGNPVFNGGKPVHWFRQYLFPKKRGNNVLHCGEPKPPESDNTCSPRSMETLSSMVESLSTGSRAMVATAVSSASPSRWLNIFALVKYSHTFHINIRNRYFLSGRDLFEYSLLIIEYDHQNVCPKFCIYYNNFCKTTKNFIFSWNYHFKFARRKVKFLCILNFF